MTQIESRPVGGPPDERFATPALFDESRQRSHRHHIDLRRLAVLLDDPLRFLRHEIGRGTRPGRVESYGIRGSGRRIVLRHRTRDLGVLDEVLGRRYYEPPAPVTRRLSAMDGPPHVVDVGANIGLFGAFVLGRAPDARITAFEPDRANAEIHRRAIEENGLQGRWRLLPACASNRDGWLHFRGDDFSGCCVVEAGSAGAARVRSVDVMEMLDGVDLLKMDAEGGEWSILADPRFAAAGVPCVVLEYHPHLCPSTTPRAAAESLLARAGYRTAPLFHRPDGVGMLWAWRRRG